MKKNTIKTAAVLLAVTMAMSLTACGAAETADTSSADVEEMPVETETEAAEETSAATEEPAEAAEDATEEVAEVQQESGDDYPGFGVYYRENDPQSDSSAEITSTDTITWTVANCTTEDNPQAVALAALAEELSEKTNGNFEWDIFYNSELGSESEAVELCRNNTVQFVTSNVTTMPTYVERIGVFALPYLFHSEEDELTYLATSAHAYDMWTE
ncbi:MAG TPA: hypothetical protein PLU43_10450, partial [Lachnospiraceae bacterium]|nr:hypothetical protein [Lachnospiraceae bacterium]